MNAKNTGAKKPARKPSAKKATSPKTATPDTPPAKTNTVANTAAEKAKAEFQAKAAKLMPKSGPRLAKEMKAKQAGANGAPQAPGQTGKLTGDSSPTQTVGALLGEITWLMTQSKSHRLMFIGDLEWIAMPPMLLRQYRLFRDDNKTPCGLALWAKVNDEVEQRLMTMGTARLKPDDWNSGENVWLIDLIAPFGRQAEMLEELKGSALKGVKFKYHQTTPDGKRAVVSVG